MRRPLVSLVLAGVVLLTACGSSGSSASDATTTTTTTTTKPPLTAGDRRIGQAALLRVADAPGYQQVAAQQSVLADLTDAATSVPACAAYLAGKPRRLGTGRAAGLQRGTTVVDASTALFRDEASARAELGLFRDPSMAKCLERVYGSPNASLVANPITTGELGDDRVAYRITRASDPNVTAGIDVIVVRIGRVLLSVNIAGTASDASELEGGAITKAVDRVRAAEGATP